MYIITYRFAFVNIFISLSHIVWLFMCVVLSLFSFDFFAFMIILKVKKFFNDDERSI